MADSPFRSCRLGDIATFRNGKAIAPGDYGQAGRHPVFGANGQIGRTDQMLNPEPVVVIGRVGAYCGSVHYAPAPSWVTDNAIVAAPGGKTDGRFLYYLLKLLDLRRTAVGSAQPLITQTGLKAISTRVSTPDEQRAIAHILGSLDDKIELNRRMNETLEQIAQAIFKSWFVDFDPVRARAEGLLPVGMDAATAALFPDSFEESALGEIPTGWRVGRLDDLLVLQRGFDLPTRERTAGCYPVFSASGFHGTHTEYMANGPGVVTGRSGVLGRAFLIMRDFWPLNTTLWVKEFKVAGPFYAYQSLRRLDFGVFNAGSAVPTLNRNHVHSLPVVVPDTRLVKLYENIANPMFRCQDAREEESQTLAAIRDALLPRLMSGEIRLNGLSAPSRGST